jgi:hypothetical protein
MFPVILVNFPKTYLNLGDKALFLLRDFGVYFYVFYIVSGFKALIRAIDLQIDEEKHQNIASMLDHDTMP